MTRYLLALGAAALLALTPPGAAPDYVYALVVGPVTEPGLLDYQIPMTPRVATIDPVAGEVVSSTPVPGCLQPSQLIVAPSPNRVWVVCGGDIFTGGSIAEVDLFTRAVAHTRAFATRPSGLAVTPDGGRLIVSLLASSPERDPSSVVVLDGASLDTLATFTATWPGRAIVAPDGSRAYVLTSSTTTIPGSVLVVDLASLSIVKSIVIPGGPMAIDMAADGSRIAVTAADAGLVAIDPATDTVRGTVDLQSVSPAGFTALAVDPTGRRAYVPVFAVRFPMTETTGVRVVDLDAMSIQSTLPTAALPFGIALSPGGGALSVGQYRTMPGHVSTIDSASGQVRTSALTVGSIAELRPAGAQATPPFEACEYSLSPAETTSAVRPLSHPGGSSGRLAVVALPDRCAWSVRTSAPWVTLDAAGGIGTRTIGYTIAANASGARRDATIDIGGRSFAISQAGCSRPVIAVDRPQNGSTVAQPYTVSGWAIDTCTLSGTGVSGVFAPFGSTYGQPRPDVAAAYGPQFLNSGFFSPPAAEVRPGDVHVVISVHDTVTGALADSAVDFKAAASSGPIGSLDTPASGAVVSGEMGVTGWTIDDVKIAEPIRVYRDAIPGELAPPGTGGRVFIGNATRVAGARPDVQAAFPGLPNADQAGFGLMVLTNFLPNGGNGTFTISVDAADYLFHVTTLGRKTITVDNASSLLPFGTIDTPAQGATVSGTVVNFGWALARQPFTIPVDGSTLDVAIDNQIVGHPVYNQYRPDIATLFPGYANSGGAVGYYTIDTRTLANGVHTLAWVVRDDGGHATAMGSRYFTVANP